MKRRLMMFSAVVAVVVTLVALNYLEPQRLTASTFEKPTEVQQRLAPEPQPGQPAEESIVAQSETKSEASDKKDAEPLVVPDVFKVKFQCSNGDFVVEAHKDWAPNGVTRFLELVKMGYFNGCRFFRVVTKPKPFVVQWGIPGDPKLAKEWWNKTIPDDTVKQSNVAGMVTFAAGQAPNSRSTQLFINLGNNKFLDGMGFAPIGKVVEGMEVVKKFNDHYQGAPSNDQINIMNKGNEWVEERFPGLDYIKTAKVVE